MTKQITIDELGRLTIQGGIGSDEAIDMLNAAINSIRHHIETAPLPDNVSAAPDTYIAADKDTIPW